MSARLQPSISAPGVAAVQRDGLAPVPLADDGRGTAVVVADQHRLELEHGRRLPHDLSRHRVPVFLCESSGFRPARPVVKRRDDLEVKIAVELQLDPQMSPKERTRRLE